MYTNSQACTYMDTHVTEFSIMLDKSTSITKTGDIISTDEDHNVTSEALDYLGDDCNTIRIKFIVRMKAIC